MSCLYEKTTQYTKFKNSDTKNVRTAYTTYITILYNLKLMIYKLLHELSHLIPRSGTRSTMLIVICRSARDASTFSSPSSFSPSLTSPSVSPFSSL